MKQNTSVKELEEGLVRDKILPTLNKKRLNIEKRIAEND